ncbi:OmpA family protein [uncultured Parasphingorhabdus sp.]|uniref:OmpA family protein n=1 Tax=uncultured Parasphingorhabdus sp. TaxID=2709694 RepID=UPI002AA90F77|nr:OmpA family protein [uncultured Parasphingorhabdus sp.]
MEIRGKILTGAAATVVLGLVGHAIAGENFINGLEQQAQTELAARGLDGAHVSLGHDPLSRAAVLDGEVGDEAKQEAMGVVMTIPGISSASWKDQHVIVAAEGEATEKAAPTAAVQTQAANCQSRVDKIIAANNISFRSGSAYVSLETQKILDQIATALQECDGLAIAVEGHTDDNGNSAVNRNMSQERADRIKAGLIERGVKASLISAKGYGSTRPRATGSDAAADAQNRRIEFRISAANGPQKDDAKSQQES